jgi:hypothetical protein
MTVTLGLDPRTTEKEARKLSERLAGMDLPAEREDKVRDAYGLLRALVYGSDNRGRYYASAALLARLFWWETVAPRKIDAWRDDLVERNHIEVAMLGINCYSTSPFPVVSIIDAHRYSRFAARRPIQDAIRVEVYQCDAYRCVTCGASDALSLDHIYPHSLGGSDAMENLQTMCQPCNSRKGNRLVVA